MGELLLFIHVCWLINVNGKIQNTLGTIQNAQLRQQNYLYRMYVWNPEFVSGVRVIYWRQGIEFEFLKSITRLPGYLENKKGYGREGGTKQSTMLLLIFSHSTVLYGFISTP